MTSIIEALKKLAGVSYEPWYDAGQLDGLDWARNKAQRKELEYAATMFKTQKERGKVVSYDPTKDEVIGLLLANVIKKYEFSWKETEPYTYVPGRHA